MNVKPLGESLRSGRGIWHAIASSHESTSLFADVEKKVVWASMAETAPYVTCY